LNCRHVRFVPSIILLNKAALVEQYYLVIHADASAGNEGILEGQIMFLSLLMKYWFSLLLMVDRLIMNYLFVPCHI
jgi:hypothetical protein